MNIRRFGLSKFASLFLTGSILFLVSELVGEQGTIPVAVARPMCSSLLSEYGTVDSQIRQLQPSTYGLSPTLARLYQRRGELKKQIEDQNCTDLAAEGWCYTLRVVPDIDSYTEMWFYPVIKNNSPIGWSPDQSLEGTYTLSANGGGSTPQPASYPLKEWFAPMEKRRLSNGIRVIFHSPDTYAFSWNFSHPLDSDYSNNQYSVRGIRGSEFNQGGSMTNYKCE